MFQRSNPVLRMAKPYMRFKDLTFLFSLSDSDFKYEISTSRFRNGSNDKRRLEKWDIISADPPMRGPCVPVDSIVHDKASPNGDLVSLCWNHFARAVCVVFWNERFLSSKEPVIW